MVIMETDDDVVSIRRRSPWINPPPASFGRLGFYISGVFLDAFCLSPLSRFYWGRVVDQVEAAAGGMTACTSACARTARRLALWSPVHELFLPPFLQPFYGSVLSH